MPEGPTGTLRLVLALSSASILALLSHSAAPQPQADFDEEIIVRGEVSRRALRIQIQRAEQVVYERFNEINSTDEFDIHCRTRKRFASRIRQRICQANFERRAEQRVGRELARNVQALQSSAQLRKRQLEEGMARLFSEDPQLRKAFVHVADLQQTLDETRRSGRSRNARHAMVSADEGSLPFGASLWAEAQIGRDFWVHDLTWGAFTIADLEGAIGSIRLRCRNSAGDLVPRDLDVATEVEWSIPDSWGPCSVRVEAQPGTTFDLYEFEQ